ncbi:MAG: extracellular solute-binding protein family 5 [Actinomycetia bacterium]|nr:extracellular solute-binding protein family 5 [Actinomycetes bacterium]
MSPVVRSSRLGALLVTAAMALSACSGGAAGSAGAKASDTLRLAFGTDMQVPDPDIFYEIEGNAVVTSVYEGLVRYKANSAEIEPWLAQKYIVSKDGLTYTFTLRSGVKFHDGTALDSAAAKASFQRRLNVNSAPAYMLADVVKMATPDPQTFVVTLRKPVSAFLDYLAAPYGPKMVSPTAVAAHAGKDFAQSWLKTHDAGTGPFAISQFQLAKQYELSRFAGYWGKKASFNTVLISIIPNISTQQLELQSGQLSMIQHGLTTTDIQSFRSNPQFTVQQFPSLYKTFIFLNPKKGVFANQAVREAFRGALDRKQLVSEVFGDRATPSTQVYPAGELPEPAASTVSTVDPSKLKTLVATLPNKKVDFAYVTDDTSNQRMAELVQTKLAAAGLDVTVRGIPIAQAFDLPNQPAQAPDAVLATLNPDAVHPDTYARIFMTTKGSLNWLGCSVPAADAALDKGLHATNPAAVRADYASAGALLAQSACWLDLADVKETVVARKSIGGFVHQLPTLNTVRLADLTTG